MRRTDKINIVCASFNKLLHYLDKSFVTDFFSETFRAYFAVLTVNASQIATRKKDRSRPVFAAYAGFFPEVKGRSCDLESFADSAKAGF